jgi:hypothetical protein
MEIENDTLKTQLAIHDLGVKEVSLDHHLLD